MTFCKLFIIFILFFCSAEKGFAQSMPNSALKQYYQSLQDWMKDSVKAKAQLVSGSPTPLDQIFDWQEISRRTFPENWVNLSGSWQKRYTQAIRKRIMTKTASGLQVIRSYIAEASVRWEEESITNDKAKTSFDIMHHNEIDKVNFRLVFSDNIWRVYDIRTENFRVIRDLLNGLDELITNGFSHEYVEAVITNADEFSIDDFNANESGDYPKLWGWRKKDDHEMRASQRLYDVQRENGDAYLSAQVSNASVALVKPFSYNIREYPYISWRWRVREFSSAAADQPPSRAAEVVVIFYQNWLGVPITLHYIWDRYATPCTTIRQNGLLFDTYAKVIRTESSPSHEWFTENVSPFEDYKRIFGEDPLEQIVGMYIITESNDPLSTSRTDYDDFVVRKATPHVSCTK